MSRQNKFEKGAGRLVMMRVNTIIHDELYAGADLTHRQNLVSVQEQKIV